MLRPPSCAKPGQVAQLQNPGDGVGRNYELVVQDRSLVHFFPHFKAVVLQETGVSGTFQSSLSICCGNLLLPALNSVAQAKNQQPPRQPRQHIPSEGT